MRSIVSSKLKLARKVTPDDIAPAYIGGFCEGYIKTAFSDSTQNPSRRFRRRADAARLRKVCAERRMQEQHIRRNLAPRLRINVYKKEFSMLS